MFFHIDFANELTIYDQIVRQVKFAVAGGLLAEGWEVVDELGLLRAVGAIPTEAP